MLRKLLDHVRFEGRPAVAMRGCNPCTRPIASFGLSSRRRVPVELDCEEAALIHDIFSACGLRMSDFRPAPLKRRMPALLRALGCEHPRAAGELLAARPELLSRAQAALVIGHTAPFRDAPVFKVLREQVVPSLPAAARVWSIGCSRGVELLSVAVLLAERECDQATLRGSDCRPVDPACDKHLVRDLMAAIPADFAGLEQIASRAWLEQCIARIEWRQENVLGLSADPTYDLILCRNVSIYLEPPAATKLWRLAVDSLAPGGWLITGKAEHPLVAGGLRRVGHCIYRRTEGSA